MDYIITPDIREQVKRANPLRELMEQDYGKKFTRDSKTLCDFHKDSKPSLHVFPDGGYKCFVCHAGKSKQMITLIDGTEWEDKGNDVLGWYANKHQCSIDEAVVMLAQRGGITLQKKIIDHEAERFKDQVTDQNRAFYHALMKDQDALNYLYDRGIEQEDIGKWRIGMVPWDWKDQRYAGRIVFGMADLHWWEPAKAKTIAMAYRARDERDYLKHRMDVNDEKRRNYLMGAKYLNDPTSKIYEKSRYLYGLNEAVTHIRKEKCAIIVEGYTDVVMMHKEGLQNVIACCGTAITEGHIEILKRYTNRVFMWLDGDAAGMKNMRRVIPLFLQHGINVMIVNSYGQDPAEMIAAGVDIRMYLKQNFKHAAQMLIDEVAGEYDRIMNAARMKALGDVLPLLQSMNDPVLQANYRAVVENRLGVSVKV